VIDDEAPLVGLEPSAISCFKDEYPGLFSPQLRGNARTLAGRSLMFEEFIARVKSVSSAAPSSGWRSGWPHPSCPNPCCATCAPRSKLPKRLPIKTKTTLLSLRCAAALQRCRRLH
jgi:hypothetical protein